MTKCINSFCRTTCQNAENCIFEGVVASELEDSPRPVGLNTYKKNQAIFLQGNQPHGVFCIHSGKVKVVMVNNEGKESIIRIASAGDIIGHRALLSNENFNATAIALEESVIGFIEKNTFLNFVANHSEIALKLLSRLSQMIGSSEKNHSTLVHKNVRERLAGFLINLIKSYGINEDGRIRLNITLTREEMAAVIGTTNETLVRLITEFKNEGIIVQEGKVIFIINEKKLVEFANV